MTPREPGAPLSRNAQALVRAANERVETIPVAEAHRLLDDHEVLFVDLRDPRELALDTGRKLVLYCGSAWRSALSAAVLIDMGFDNVAHLEGGFAAWKGAGHPVVSYEPGH